MRPVSMSLRFGSLVRLRSRAEFTRVQNQGRRVSTRYLTLLAMPNALDRDRLGIIASRRLGGAVERNRAKRRLRDVFRRQEPDTAVERRLTALDLVVIPRRELIDAPARVIEQDFRAALGRLDRARGR
jgi:ribonuclease P protein component